MKKKMGSNEIYFDEDRMKRIFIMEILCIYAKRGFLPEFSKCIVISSSVARMRGRSERLERKRERQKREKRKTSNK